MIGNDVVDLQLAAGQSNWRRKGFLEKVFTTAEQDLITAATEQEIMVWLLWSMKEAAYKAHQRQFNLPPRLNWQIQECKLQDYSSTGASGKVFIEEKEYYTTSEITGAYIHTSAGKTGEIRTESIIFEAPASAAKAEVKRKVAESFSVSIEGIQLKKDRFGMPFLTIPNLPKFTSFSLSAHGRFSACMLSLINCETTVKHP